MLSPPGPRTDRSTTARISDNTQTVRPYGCNQVSGSNQDIHRTQYKRPAQLAFYTVGTAGFETHDPLTPQGALGWFHYGVPRRFVRQGRCGCPGRLPHPIDPLAFGRAGSVGASE